MSTTSNRCNRAPRVRRIAACSAWALAAFILGGGLAGFAAAGNPPPTLPPEFSVPQPAPGDAGRYSLTVVERAPQGFKVVDAPRAAFSFEWRAGGRFVDADGGVRFVNDLWTGDAPGAADRRPFGSERTYLFDAATSQFLALQTSESLEEEASDPSLISPVVAFKATSERTLRVQYANAPVPPEPPPCGLVHPFQRGRLALGDEVRLPGPCRAGAATWPDARMRAVAQEDVAGRPTVAFAAATAGFEPAYLWWAADVPYPLRIAVAHGDRPGVYDVYRLERFERGPETPFPGAPPPAAAGPPLTWAPRESWGPAEGGEAQAYPFSEAWEQAKNHPDAADLRAFLAQHPDAYVASARFLDAARPMMTSLAWTFLLTDGQDTFSATFTRQRLELAESLGAPAPLDGPVQPLTTHRYERSAPPAPSRPGEPPNVPPSQVPDRLPRLESLADRWRAVADSTAGVRDMTSWGFELGCRDEACIGVHLAFTVGYRSSAEVRRASTFHHRDSDFWTLVFDPEGRLAESTRTTGDHRTVAVPANGGAPESWPAEERLAALDVGLATNLWRLPIGPLAAATGFAAVAAGLLYQFWPAAKGLIARGAALVGGYHRLDADDLVRHPMRAKLLALVRARPGASIPQLRLAAGTSRSNARHHLRLLRRSGHVRSFRVRGTWRYVAFDHDVTRAHQAAWLEAEPHLRDVLRLLDSGPMRASELAIQLCRQRGWCRSTSWDLLKKAERAKLVSKERAGRFLLIRSTGDPPRHPS